MRSPVLFLIFNRPQLTRKTFAYIRAARPPKLYVAADGARADRLGETELCAEARKVLELVDWDCEINYQFQKENLGCGRAVRAALDWFFANESEGVIIEDDLEFSPDFFTFCDAMLEKYRDTEKVMAITGDNFQFGLPRGAGDYYFSCLPHCWGWATWARAWQKYDWEMRDLDTVLPPTLAQLFPNNFQLQQVWYNTFTRTKAGQIDTWAFRWTYSVWINGGLSVNPNVNLARNVGFSTDATHTTQANSFFPHLPLAGLPAELTHPAEITRDADADNFMFPVVLGWGRENLAAEIWRRQSLGLRGSEIILTVLLETFGDLPEFAALKIFAPEKFPAAAGAEILARIRGGDREIYQALDTIRGNDSRLTAIINLAAQAAANIDDYHAFVALVTYCGAKPACAKQLSQLELNFFFPQCFDYYTANIGSLTATRYYDFHRNIFNAAIHGMGLLNWQNSQISGEAAFLQAYLEKSGGGVVIDVGANRGDYAREVRRASLSAKIFALEPHPETFARLQTAAAASNFAAFNLGISDTSGEKILYDRSDTADGSTHASVYKGVLEKIHRVGANEYRAQFVTLDEFISAQNIDEIALLKIDTEGHELAVLRGGIKTLRAGKIRAIQFEFNEMNVESRVFLKDFYELLPDYKFYRLLPDGMIPLGEYQRPLALELFAMQNIAAIRRT